MTNSNQRHVVVGDGQFIVDGERYNLYGGAVHYWRLDRGKWDSILESVKGMGFNMISIYMPWEIHEISKGVFDFSGNKDVDAFLTLCEEKGLTTVARPGPQINSELTWFGYPKRILENDRLHARNAKGGRTVLTQVPKPIPALNYAAEEFFEETALWYDAICAILAKHAYPNGGLVATQVDNEMAYFFCINAYAADFSDDSLHNYRTFLLEKYGTLDAVNSAHNLSATSMDEVDAPRRFTATTAAEIPRYADWIEYREVYLVDSMDRLAGMMRERGLGKIALFHNYPHPLGPGGAASGFTTPFNIAKLEEKLDFVGFDIYSRKELYGHVKTVGSYVVGTSRYPYIPEFIAGVWPWYLHPGELYDEEFVTKAALAQGIKGFSRYMLVERDRWLDSPVRRDGRVREDHAEMFGAANRLQVAGRFADLRRESDVLLLANREYDRLEAASVLVSFPGDFLETPSGFSEYANPLTISEHRLGFDQPPQLEKSEWFGAFHSALSGGGYDFLLSDTSLNPSNWAKYKVVTIASLDYLDAAVQQALVDYAAGGGTVVVGPRAPRMDSLMRPCTILADNIAAHAPRIVLVESKEGVADALVRTLADAGVQALRRNDPRLDVIVHGDSSDPTRKVVFVVNPTADAIDASVAIGVALTSATELWSGESFATLGDSITAAMKPYSIHVYECLAA
ncbi:MAG: beta-galactosidase [Propionibacteriaceae bacterium]|nr:beta-galactosidase [Micropruina sp.]HBX79653.1 beta-galactosidase [Propionibacteriaceae bacterium]HBY23725.1 beta-galactosidase [Propionibacteriaceae bacterium]